MRVTRSVMVAVLLATPIASADPAQDEIARGAEAIRANDYDGAIAHYEQARAAETQADPELVWKLADAHRLAAQHATDGERASQHRVTAIRLYNELLATQPTEDLEIRVRGWLAKLEAQENERRDQAQRDLEEKLRAQESQNAAALLSKGEERKKRTDAVRKANRESDLNKARIVKISGIAGIGAGVVASGVGVYFGLKARSLSNQLTSENVYDQQKISAGQNDDRYMGISYAAGGALLLGGGITYWIGGKIGDRAETAPVAVVPTARGAALVVSGSF